MILLNETTVAVVDGARLRLFRNRGHEPQIDLVELAEPAIAAENQGSGGRHHSSTANPDMSRLAEDNFAAAAADHLNRQVLSGEIGTLFVIADPRTLGELRRHFHDTVRAKLVGDLAKDLTAQDRQDIERILAKA
ncbi:host attachment protein [Mesorhizobium sp. J428]|uniref:host attachment protein n=1 Tax=Mesorhizobium sp. J428 TaxID=2898440 RepID=UPI002150C692|nr:host attachment protein [Mesorhizobium sp. J428]MCR5858658.1 host attachment protein [Mesorhizobium sp. J428]